jgi:ubiquinone/menaquinone biosynthesis C-methylase UbiE
MGYTNPAAYERFMGRWSAELAPLFIRFAGIADGQRVLDVGCGTGVLSRALLAAGAQLRVAGVDPVDGFVSFARSTISDARAEFRAGSVEALPFADQSFDAALALLVLQGVQDAGRAVREMARVTRRGGRVAACHWDFENGLPMLSLLWEAAAAVAPEETARRRAGSSPQRISDRDDLARRWTQAGLTDVTTGTLEIAMRFGSFEDYWQPFLAGATPTSAFAASLNGLTNGELERALRARIPGLRPDGSFVLPARAWAVVGVPAD